MGLSQKEVCENQVIPLLEQIKKICLENKINFFSAAEIEESPGKRGLASATAIVGRPSDRMLVAACMVNPVALNAVGPEEFLRMAAGEVLTVALLAEDEARGAQHYMPPVADVIRVDRAGVRR
jgi:hypothetical protein